MPILFENTGGAQESPEERPAAPAGLDGREGFGFLAGRWTVAHRRLGQRLAGDTSWAEFEGVCESRPIIGGLGTIDENVLNLPVGAYHAATLRVFDPAAKLWSVWWIDERDPRLQPPVHGRFESGICTLFGDDVLDDGRPVRVRCTYSEITARSARWDQAFSADGGVTWEDNWTMRFGRAA